MRLKEIEARIAEIKTELETRGAELTVEQSNALVDEAEKLTEERKQLVEAAEKRNAALAGLASGAQPAKVVRTFAAADGEEGDDDALNSMAYRKAFMEYVTRGTAIPMELRANQSTTTNEIGAALPTVVIDQIVSKLESVGNILNLVTKTAYKGGVTIPVEAAKPTATWVNEGAGSDTQQYTAGDNLTFAYHKLRCAVSVSLEVDTMSIAAFEKLLVNNIVEAMTKKLENAIIVGDGSGKPTGIMATTPVETVEVAALNYAALCNAEAAVPEAYEANAKWVMSKKTFMGFVGMVDDNGQPIARINYGIGGKPERFLLGREVVTTEHLGNFATIDANTKFAAIFDFANYLLNTNYAIGIKKYEDNATDDLVTKGIMLVDGKVVDANGLVHLKKIASV